MKIVTFESLEVERLKAAKLHEQLQQRYNSDPAVKHLADEIHQRRMMAPPACDQCIEIAIARIDEPHP